MVQNASGMKTFAIRPIRGVLMGIFLGATTALCARLLHAATNWIFPTFPAAFTKIPLFWSMVAAIAATALLLGAGKVASFAARVYRSWTAGIIIGVIPIWFLVSLLFFLLLACRNRLDIPILFGIGLLPIIAGAFQQYRFLHKPS